MMFYQSKEMMWEVMHAVDMSYCHFLIKNLLLSSGLTEQSQAEIYIHTHSENRWNQVEAM